MATDQRLTADRFFGPIDERLKNFHNMLSYVASESPHRTDLIEWLLQHTPASSRDAVQRRLSFLTTIGILAEDADYYTLTPVGTDYVEEKDPKIVFQCLREHVQGFEEILSEAIEQPLTDTAIAEILSRQTEFTGGAGVAMRHREWLQMLGYMEPVKDGSGYRLTEQGMALANATISAEKSRTDQTATAVFMARGYKDNPFHRHITRSLANYLSLPEVITAG